MNTGQQATHKSLSKRQQDESQPAPVIICDGLQTPENFGSILRVADAAGSKKVLLLDSDINLSDKKITKLARSADKHLSIQSISLPELINTRESFRQMIALEITTQSKNLFESTHINCDTVVIGHESRGIREDVLMLCDSAIHLPMYGVNSSMNISHALAIFLYEWQRQHSTPQA